MICLKCGNTIEDEAIFCPCCGGRVNEMKPTEPEPVNTVQAAVPTVSAAVSSEPVNTVQTAVQTEISAKQERKKEFFGVGAFVACLVVIAVLAASTGTFAFLYFSAVGAL